MSIDSLFTTAITIITPGVAEDRYGNLQPDWDNATSVETVGWLTQLQTSEELAHRDTEVSGWRLFLPATVVISAVCRVQAGTLLLEVQGRPDAAHTPAGAHHIEVPLRFVAENEADTSGDEPVWLWPSGEEIGWPSGDLIGLA